VRRASSSSRTIRSAGRRRLDACDSQEADEDFLVDLTSPTNAGLADGQASVVIVDDDSWPELTHGQAIATDLRAQPGPTADADVYQVSQKPYGPTKSWWTGSRGTWGPRLPTWTGSPPTE